MPILRIVEPPMVNAQMYDAVNAELDVDRNPPEGLIMHAAGDVGGQWQIVELWESEEHARRFDEERLRPAIDAVTGIAERPAPKTTAYEPHKLIRR